jgi:hypothetical protein
VANITPEHQRAIDLMAQAQATTNEAQANALISQAMTAAQQSGANNAVAFQAVHDHARQIQDRNVALRPPNFPPNFAPNFSPGVSPPFFPAAAPPAQAPPPAKPVDPWITRETYTAPPGVKQADPDIVLFQDRPISPEFLVELLYEDIAGVELINISRSDIIDGQNVSYSPVKQLSSLRRRYNPNNIIGLPELSSSFFSRFQIELLFRGVNPPYFDEQGNLVIEINDVGPDEIIETEIDTNGTINEVDFS